MDISSFIIFVEKCKFGNNKHDYTDRHVIIQSFQLKYCTYILFVVMNAKRQDWWLWLLWIISSIIIIPNLADELDDATWLIYTWCNTLMSIVDQ